MGNNCRRKRRWKSPGSLVHAGKKKRGYRAEVRRERKKRDILSPVNVLHTKSV